MTPQTGGGILGIGAIPLRARVLCKTYRYAEEEVWEEEEDLGRRRRRRVRGRVLSKMCIAKRAQSVCQCLAQLPLVKWIAAVYEYILMD